MIDDREVWASASHVLGTYGDHANMFIGFRIRNLAMAGDQADIAMWRMIADRLDALRDGQGAGEARH